MRMTFEEMMRIVHANQRGVRIATCLRMARLADLGAEIVELVREDRYSDSYRYRRLVEKYFPEPESPPTPSPKPMLAAEEPDCND